MAQSKPTKHVPQAGQRFGKLRVVQRVADKNTKTANLIVQVRVECDCGNRLTLPYFYLIRTHIAPRTDCGKCGPTSFQAQHYLAHRSWYMMNVRCTNPKHVAWKHYGGRGIKVCERWSWDNPDGFRNFIEDMGDRPGLQFSLDRIDNDGNYEPIHSKTGKPQCRWATAKEQRANQTRSPLDPIIHPELEEDPEVPIEILD